MKQIRFVVVLVFATSVFASAQTTKEKPSDGKTEQLIQRLENEGREATLKNDVKANDHLLADSWLNINPDGSITTKARLMKLLTESPFKIMSIENDEVLVRVYGATAVVTGRSTTKRAGQGSEVVTRRVRFTRVYAKIKERWQVVSAHNTLVSEPG